MQIVVNGLLTSYQRSGSGKQLLILHGWGDSSAGWRKFADRLAKNYEVITIDLPGFGGTQVPNGAWDLDDYANFVAAVVDKLDLKLAVLIGHSNGGAIAIRGLSRGVLTASKLVLLASAGIRNEYKGRNKVLRLVTKAGKVVTSPLPKTVKKKLQRKVYATVGSDMLVAEHLQETFKKVVTDDVRADAQKIAIPTLLIYGQNDQSAPVRYGELLHEQMSNSTLEILPGAEHFLHLEQPDEVIRLIEEFLR